MPDWLSSIFSLSKEVSSKIALPVFLALLAVVLIPTPYAGFLGVDKFRADYGTFIGFVLFFSGAVLVANLIWRIGEHSKQWIESWLLKRRLRPGLHDLTEPEKELLRPFMREGQSEIHANVNSGTINILVQKSVVFRPSNLSIRHTTFAYILQPWAREYLQKHPHLLD